jgi:hypothetical protein
MKQLPWQVEKIVYVARCMRHGCPSGASTSEKIAAAFVLNRMDYLPDSYSDVIEAWERLDDWQQVVKYIKRNCMHLVEAG